MKKSLWNEMYGVLFSIVAFIAFLILVKTGVFHDATSWIGAKIVEPLNLK